MSWKIFEKNSRLYLKKIFEEIPSISFKSKGGANSLISDIEIMKNGESLFFIDCKLKVSQAAQFVVLNDITKRKFHDSPLNKGESIRRHPIIEHMNKNYASYSSPGQKKLLCEKNMMIDCIKKHFISKNIRFIISSLHHSNFKEFPIRITDIENLRRDFMVEGVYRNKKSGSSSLPKSERTIFKNIAKKNFKKYSIEIENERTFILFNQDAPNNLYIKNTSYYLSRKEKLRFEIRKLSKTNNSNVIFSMRLIELDSKDDIDQLSRILKN
jgi:hypothetical protein